jgi:ankyrin repeat protein
MGWADKLSGDELVDSIAIFRDHPDFIQARNQHLANAVRCRDIQLIEVLLNAGAGPDWVDAGGDTLLLYLVHEYRVTRTSQGPTILQIATLLLEHGASPELVDAGNWRAIDHCTEQRLDAMTNLLVRFGADPTQREYV